MEMILFLLFYRRDDVELRPLTDIKDIEKADSVWSARNAMSLQFLQLLAKRNPNVGAFKTDGKLVSWVFQ